ncbi:MAG: glucose 1-dehydrogenase [Alphaproteobacteria bacterium]
MISFDGRVAIVTGGAQGIGAAIAKGLGKHGATVVIADINGHGGAEVAASIGNDAFAIETDVGDLDQIAKLHSEVIERAGKIDILINNAAIIPPQLTWEEIDHAEWQRFMRVNLDAVFFMCQTSAKHMWECRYGRIVNICSNTVIWGTPGLAHYVAAKGGVLALTRALATELGPYDITINSVSPGMTASEGILNSDWVEFFDFVEPTQAFKGRGTPEDIASSVLFLASENARWVTGSMLNTDGGAARW